MQVVAFDDSTLAQALLLLYIDFYLHCTSNEKNSCIQSIHQRTINRQKDSQNMALIMEPIVHQAFIIILYFEDFYDSFSNTVI